MSVALLYSGLAVAGYVMAIPLRTKAYLSGYIAKVLPLVVTMLIFLMGFRVGSNEEVISNLAVLGGLSLSMAVFSLVTAVGSMRLLRRALGYDRYGGRVSGPGGSDIDDGPAEAGDSNIGVGPAEAAAGELRTGDGGAAASARPEGEAPAEAGGGPPGYLGTVRYIIAMFLGFFIGFFMVIKSGTLDAEASKNVTAIMVTYGLYTLVFLVGVDLGLAGDILKKFAETGARILIFPVVGMITTIATIFLFFPLLPLNPQETLGVACTFGWYSLGPNILIDHGLVMAGAYAFLTNFARVMLSLFTTPFVAARFGYLETITMAQAASMDVCIYTIGSSTNSITTAYAFASGLVFTVLVPVIMPIVASL